MTHTKDEAKAATPHHDLIAELLNPNTPKTEREHAASREIERLQALEALPLELRGVQETVKDGDGFWRSCSGCHELNEGHATGPFSKVFGCALGNGCSECGGIGAVWDDTDYEEIARTFDEPDQSAAQPAPVHPDSARIDWLTNNPLDALDIFGHVKGSDAVRWIRQEIDNAMLKKDGATHD